MEAKKTKKYQEYNIGLDIGTNSVGWAVTDFENNILKYKNKNMWGARLFEAGNTSAETRKFRGIRRRIQRRRERINILQSLLLDDIEKEYPNFFPMLRESSKVQEEKEFEKINGKKYNLFSELNFSDITYYKKYPTIYHLRQGLIDENKKFDIRLIYLAIHHIIKYRGNFLYEGNLENDGKEILETINTLIDFIKNTLEIKCILSAEDIRQILMKKEEKKIEKKEKLLNAFDYTKNDKAVINNIVSSILGYKFDLTKIFDINIENGVISFSNEIENEDEIKEILQDQAYMYDAMQKTYNWFVLQDILQGNRNISEAYIKKYDKYKNDLRKLKELYKKYLSNQYKKMFKYREKDNYVAYNDEISKCSLEDLYKRIKKDLSKIENNDEVEKVLSEIENENFLIKINTTENAVIPYQLHYKELKEILENQSKYYKTLEENKQHILDLMKFRIPYYVGPLAKENQSRFAWIIRKSNEKILPWTFEKVVDIDQTAEMFIRRMTNKCTYLLNKDVIPKQSILYSEFCVLNELANIRINNHKLTSKEKQLVIEKLFKIKKIVKINDLKQLLLDYQVYSEIDTITGIVDDYKFMSNMSSFIDMKNLFGKIDEDNIEMIEKIIEWMTIFEDKKILKSKIKSKYGLDEKMINQLAKKNYSGWSRLSKELLVDLKSYDDNKSIMEKLYTTKENFMQIINNDKYGFNKQIERIVNGTNEKITYETIKEIQTSPSNKRAIWQCLKVVKEIAQVMKREPKNIYVEFAREEQEKGKKNDNRAKKLLNIYDKYAEEIKQLKDYNPKVYKELKSKQSDKEFTERLYLYFTQNGRCMYSSEPLNINTLYLYEVDHILPQNYIKDDSLSNKVLVKKEENQRKSGSLLLDDKIINRQEMWWKQLHKSGLIDDKKYYNLIRRKLFESDSDKVKFISRQLVETRQSIKNITNLLTKQYPNTNIFAIRAELTSSFRKEFEMYKNRNVNDYHHAQDAFIISIVGNTIDTKLKYKDEYKYTEYVKKYIKDSEDNKNKTWIIMKMISNNMDYNMIKRVFNYKDCFITRKLEEQTGAFYNQTLYGPNDSKVKAVIPLKENMNVEKYGGYSSEKKAYFIICSYLDKKYRLQTELIGIPIKIAYDIKNKKITLQKYVENVLKDATDIKIIKDKILKYQEYLDENNEPMVFLSDSEVRTNKQLVIEPQIARLVYNMNREKELTDKEKEEIENKMLEIYNYLLEKLETEYKSYYGCYLKLNSIDIKQKFQELSIQEKTIIINEIIKIMNIGTGNFKILGLSMALGRKNEKSFKTDVLKKMIFIDKSVTGMYERRYRINGMENNGSK